MFATDEKFMRDLDYAEIGENKCLEQLNACTEVTAYVEDVRKDERYQIDDIDFVLHKRDGSIVNIEVKTDRQAHRTGNFVYETMSNSNQGCLARSKADFIYYYLSETDTVYMVHLQRLRAYLSTVTYKEVNMGDGARGYLIPFFVIIQQGLGVQIV